MISVIHICNICDKKFKNKNILNRHLREKHLQGPIYKCNLCKTCFSRKERLMRHLQSVHFNLKYQCPIAECGKKFVEKFRFRVHMSRSHNYLVCPKCKKIFTNSKKSKKKTKKIPKHDCMIIRKIFRCKESDCEKDNQTYSRLNFFLRHLQKVHDIMEFEEIKKRVDQGIIEKEKWFIPKPKNRNRQKEEVKIEEFLDTSNYNILTKNENVKSTNESVEIPERGDGLVSKLGEEIVNNINILCIMENNRKKIKKKKEARKFVKYKTEEIVLGKR